MDAGNTLHRLLIGACISTVGCASSSEGMQSCEGTACESGTAGHDSPGDPDDDDGTSGDGETGAGSPQGGTIPCDVAQVLAEHCWSCHADTPSFGAPMSLSSLEDFRLPAITDPGSSVAELTLERIFDAERPMPAAGMPSEDRDRLAAWIEGGLPSGSMECDQPEGEGADVGPDALPCEPTHVFRAHGEEGPDAAFEVPVLDDLYECFTFRPSVDAPIQATARAPIIDDERVVHHWILYRSEEALPDGAHGPCEMPEDAVFVAGWAPGGGNFEMPADVGLEFAKPDDSFILQVHYNNTAGYQDARDRSGVALCTADEPRPIEAGVVTLGSLGIAIPPQTEDHVVQGTCPPWVTNFLPEPLHVISSFPHMHELGRSFTTEILRGGSEDDVATLVDVDPFDFANQTFYPHEPEVVVNPGDAVRTTCTYDNPTDDWVWLGEGTSDEMCFNFAVVYPIDLLGDGRNCGLL